MKIKSTKKHYTYLQENSWWIKDLNRSSNNYLKFIDYVKDHYHLKASDKISDAIDSVELLSNVFEALK